jgi:hypothetical protein
MIAMTRPLTKRELALAATPLMRVPVARQQHRKPTIAQFVIVNVYRGIALGISVALFVLLTDTFGIFSLIASQSAPLTTGLIFVLVTSFKFVALTIAVAVGLAAVHAK